MAKLKLEKFIRPFLRMITDDNATIVFKLGEDELSMKSIDYNVGKNQWTINLTRY